MTAAKDIEPREVTAGVAMEAAKLIAMRGHGQNTQAGELSALRWLLRQLETFGAPNVQ